MIASLAGRTSLTNHAGCRRRDSGITVSTSWQWSSLCPMRYCILPYFLEVFFHKCKYTFIFSRLGTELRMNIFVHLILFFVTIFLLVAYQSFQNDIHSTAVINKPDYDCVGDAGDLIREKRSGSRKRRRRRRRKRFRCRIRLFSPKCRRAKKNWVS